MVKPETNAVFEILSIDLEKKRMGLALVPEGSARGLNVNGGAAEQEAGEMHEAAGGDDVGFGSLADKLRGALRPRDK